jgi:hypothetical protein
LASTSTSSSRAAWFVVYWGGFGGIPNPTKYDGKVTIVNGKFRAPNERSKIHTLTVKPPAGTVASETTRTR